MTYTDKVLIAFGVFATGFALSLGQWERAWACAATTMGLFGTLYFYAERQRWRQRALGAEAKARWRQRHESGGEAWWNAGGP